jgi:hypothetical protein
LNAIVQISEQELYDHLFTFADELKRNLGYPTEWDDQSDGYPIVIHLLKQTGSSGQQVLPIQVLKRAHAELKKEPRHMHPEREQEWDKENKLILNALKVRTSH